MNIKRLLAIALTLAGAACASAPSAPKTSGKIAVVQIDAMTLASKDKKLQRKNWTPEMFDAMAAKLKEAGAKVVVIDMVEQRDPTDVAINAVQEYTGKMLEQDAVPRDAKGQLKLDAPANNDWVTTVPFADAFHQTAAQLRAAVSNKIVYIGCTACGKYDTVETDPKTKATYPRLFADARLSDQVMLIALTPKSNG